MAAAGHNGVIGKNNTLPRQILFILVLFQGTYSFGQDSTRVERPDSIRRSTIYQKGDFAMGPFFTAVRYENFNTSKFGVGLGFEKMVTRNIGFNAVLIGGKDYCETNGGTIVYLTILLLTKGKGASLLPIIIAENPSFHFSVSQKLELVPYASFFKIRYMWEENPYYSSEIFASWSLGLRAVIRLADKWNLTLFGEGSQLYYSGRPNGIQLGLSVNFVN